MSDILSKIKLVIIGGGPAGLSAALGAAKNGIAPDEILIIERDSELGGILNQCIHAGFGLHHFGEELTGPEYAGRFVNQVKEAGIQYITDSMVLSLTEDRTVSFVSPTLGYQSLKADAVVLAMGCRERTRGALNIPGSRPAGIFSAGTAQRYVNIEGYMPGNKVVILGSGDIGLIMARRMTLEGAKVLRVCELMPYSSGLARNIAQCLDDFDIPLYLSHTVTEIRGKERVEGVVISKVDENRRPIPGTEEYVECDTLLLSVGLIPENELSREANIRLDPVTSGAIVTSSRETSIPGVFACGNVLHVHDLVDYVTEEAAEAGASAAKFITGTMGDKVCTCPMIPGDHVRYIVPQIFTVYNGEAANETEKFYFRTDNIYKKVKIKLTDNHGNVIVTKSKPIVTPGEMESIVLSEEEIARLCSAESASISIETAQRGGGLS